MISEKSKNKIVEPRTLKGFRDLLPEEAIIKTELLSRLRAVFESFSYAPIETPHLEYTEVLMPQASEEISKQLFRFSDNGGRDVCLRFDLTVPFARFVAEHKSEIGLPFKRYAMANVFRGERPQFGRYREFTQCDFDFIGVTSPLADCETIELVCRAMQALEIENFKVHFNTRELMNSLSVHLGFADRSSDVLRIIDKLAKIGRKACEEELKAEASLANDVIGKIFDFVELSNKFSGAELFGAVRDLKIDNVDFLNALKNLESTYNVLIGISGLEKYIKVDFSIARGLGYYTGTVFETFLTDLPSLGSVCSGGRYDNLVSNYTNEKLIGVGGSVGLDRLIAGLVELKKIAPKKSLSDVLISLMSEESRPSVYNVANLLRNMGLKVEVYPDAVKLGKQFQYAEKQGINWVLVMGEDEIKDGSCSIKNMSTREQNRVSILELVSFFEKVLSR